MPTQPSSLQPSAPIAPDTQLPRRHRAMVALYALDAQQRPREEILQINNVSEADLAEYEEEWVLLRNRNQPGR